MMLSEYRSTSGRKIGASLISPSSSSPDQSRRGSLLLLPEIYTTKSNSISIASENQSILSTELINKTKLLIKKSSERLPKVAQISTIGVEVCKIFDGAKAFLKEKIKAQIIMFEHKHQFSQNLSSSCIEIISYVHEFETVDVPRIYIASAKIFPRLRNKLMVKGSHLAQESIVSYL